MEQKNLEGVLSTLSEERFLDSKPKLYSMKLCKPPFTMGTADTLRTTYQQNRTDSPGRIVVGQAVITTTPEVMAILRAVLLTGCCSIEQRSSACREVFLRAFGAGQNIDTPALLATFVEADENPFVPVIQDAIREILA